MSDRDFFVSYTSSDREWAEWVGWTLEAEGYSVKLQAWDFAIGQNFVLEMDKAAKECERTILILSAAYQSSKYTPSEWTAAFARNPTGEDALLLPIRVEECSVEGILSPIARIDLFGHDESRARDLVLAAVQRSRAKPITAPKFPGTKLALRNDDRPRFPASTINEYSLSTSAVAGGNAVNAQPPPAPAVSGLDSDTRLEGSSHLLASALADRNPTSRRKTITALVERHEAMRPKTVQLHLFLSRLHRAAALEARTVAGSQVAWERAIECGMAAIDALKPSVKDRHEVLHVFAELAVDYAQSGIQIGAEANRLIKTLNTADGALGQDVFEVSTHPSPETKELCAVLLTQRSKINRALAKVKHLRGAPGSPRTQNMAIDKCKTNSLRYSESAVKSCPSQPCRFERVLSHFANSRDYDDQPAKNALSELSSLVAEGYLTPAGYELCRQFNYRHQYGEVVALFPQCFQADKTRRRAYQCVHDYAWAIKGLHAQSVNGFALPASFLDDVLQAKLWLEECISFGYHTALDNVLLAYVRSILGLPEDESLAALSALNPIGGGIINELDDLSKHQPEGVAAGLLLGLSDPAVWNLIGTYLKTWTTLKELAIRFYEKARLLEPAHPMHSFNKALLLADLHRFTESRVALEECLRKRSNRRSWSTANESSIENLRTTLHKSLDS